MKSKLFACVIILLAIQMSVLGVTRAVPVLYSTIQEAVDAAQAGDTILVQQNIFNDGNPYTVTGPNGVTIGPGLHGLTIKSYTPTDPNCVADTIIDCAGSSRAFTLLDDPGAEIIIEGFTIINGMATGPVGADGAALPDPNDPNGPPIPSNGEDALGFGYGGAIKIGAGNAPIIRNCVFSNCQVYGAQGGAGLVGFVFPPTDPNDPNELPIIINSSNGGKGDGSGFGGAIYCDLESTPTIVDCFFSSNFAFGGLGGAGGDAGISDDPNIPMNGGNGGDGEGGGQGGAIYADRMSDPNILRCAFTTNTVSGPVGGIGGQAPIDPNASGAAGNGGNITLNGMCRGGAIYYETAVSNDLNLSTFRFNESVEFGGAIFCDTGTILSINPGCMFEFNHAVLSGGALGIELSIVNINSVSLLSNRTDGDGGAIYAGAGAELYLLGSSLSSNTAVSGGAITAEAGAIVEIDSCALGLNIATDNGGAVNAKCQLSIKSSSFSSNRAILGGAVYGEGVEAFGDGLFVDCTIRSNTAENTGGGICLQSGRPGLPLKIVNCEIADNSVLSPTGWGGGFAGILVETVFENCRILRNSSSLSGGGIHLFLPYDTQVKNCLFVDNSAYSDGGAISSNYPDSDKVNLSFSNCTFVDNTLLWC